MGVNTPGWQKLVMGLIAAVGGFFTLITFSVEKVPQSVVILCVRVYSP